MAGVLKLLEDFGCRRTDARVNDCQSIVILDEIDAANQQAGEGVQHGQNSLHDAR
jgi:hypothetical protein